MPWPNLRSAVESAFQTSERLDTQTEADKGHGRIEERIVTVLTETDWLTGPRRFPGETRLPGAKTLIRVASRTELKDRGRFDTRCFVASRVLPAAQAAQAVRGHWAIETGWDSAYLNTILGSSGR